MTLRNIHTGEIITVPDNACVIMNAYIIPEQVLYKKDYERIDLIVKNDGDKNGH